MTSEQYRLVWWVKKYLPHRKGQWCRRIDHDPETGFQVEPEPWQAAEGWRLFEFEDGTREWGPKHCARRPDRDWKDRLEHATPECTGRWHPVRGDYACPSCGTWVRANDKTREAFRASHRTDHALQSMVAEQKWMAVIEAVREGCEPLEFARLLDDAPGFPSFAAGYREAMWRSGVQVRGYSEARTTDGD